MEVRLQKWGSSNWVKIPNSLLEKLNLKTNDIVELNQLEDIIIIYKPKKHKTLAERIKEFNELPPDEKGNCEDYNWTNDLGKENLL